MIMPRSAYILTMLFVASTSAFHFTHISPLVRTKRMAEMAMDYNNPVVAEEFMKCQQATIEDVEAELLALGVVPTVMMNEMDVRLMLVECRLRASGRMPGKEKKKEPKKTSFINDFERALYEKPAFKALYEKSKQNTDYLNIMAEYMIYRDRTIAEYSVTYKDFLAEIEEALNAKVEKLVTSPKVDWFGFPSSMGEEGIRATLAALGELVEFSAEESEDGMTMNGRVVFGDADTAKKCVDQYDGMDMGLGTAIEMDPV